MSTGRSSLVSNDPVQIFWSSVFTRVQDWVIAENEQSESGLAFETMRNGFRVHREPPFLAVERWLDDNLIYGRKEPSDKRGRKMPPVKLGPLTITGENEAWLPDDPLLKQGPVTVDDVVHSIKDLFQSP